LLPRRQAEYGLGLHRSSWRRLAPRLGYAWKRCPRSLRRQRNAAAFTACQAPLRQWHRAEQRGEGAVVYVEQGRFSRQAPVPYAGQRRGQRPLERPAVRGSGGHSVLGFWPAAAAGQPRVAYQRAGALTADLFALAVDECSSPVTGPTVLVLDNASIHKACLVKARHAHWASRGVQRLFLPPYSPELNKIERLWHRCNHYWIRPEDDLSDDVLRERIEYILTRVGTEYTLTFN
jgi:hypothetical protein